MDTLKIDKMMRGGAILGEVLSECLDHIKPGVSEFDIDREGGCRKLGNYDIISNNTIMNKLSIMMKKLLDKDTQTLVKAGFINGDLDLTGAGQSALNTVLFIEKKAELVKLAEEVLAEAEKNK